jgi:hypothetical protein
MVDVTVPPDNRVTDAGLNDTLGPDGETVLVSVRLPLNPLRLVRVIVRVAVEPCVTLRTGGLGLTWKSGMVTVTATVVTFVAELLVPVIVTV